MYEVWRAELRQEGRYYIAEEDNAFRDVSADEVEGGREDYNVEDIVNKSWILLALSHAVILYSSSILELRDPGEWLTGASLTSYHGRRVPAMMSG